MTAAARLASDRGTLAEVVRAHAAERPRHVALIGDRADGTADVELDYAALDRAADGVAAWLQARGVARGDTVGLLGGNSLEWVIVLVGAMRAGALVAPLPTGATAETLARMLADCAARWLFLDDDAAAILAPVAGRIAAQRVRLESLVADLDRGARPAPVELAPTDAATLIYSSGTTGTPKGIVQPHAMRWAHVQRGGLLGYAADAITLIALPLWSNTTLVSLFPALGHGGTVVLMRRFDAPRFLALAEHRRVTHAMLVPVLVQRLLASPAFDRADLSSFRMKTCTSAPFAAAVKADVVRRWPGGLTEFYGMSEGGASCMLPAHLHPDKLHTVGRPQPGHEIRLVDDDGRDAGDGPGEVVGRSPMMMTGYLGQPEATRDAEWFDAAGHRFIRTGDVGRLDADGFLTLVDRKKDVIISGGANVFPSDLEAVLRGHPDVQEVAVVGAASAQWGETPVAFVVARSASIDAEAVRRWCNERVGKVQRLAAVELLDSLPRNAVGKVLKRELRARLGGEDRAHHKPR